MQLAWIGRVPPANSLWLKLTKLVTSWLVLFIICSGPCDMRSLLIGVRTVAK